MPTQELIDRAVDAYNAFCAHNPDYTVCEANASLLADAVKRLRLPFHELSSLQHAWVTVRPRTVPARKSAPAPTAAPAPAVPQSGLTPERITAEAERMIRDGEVSNELVFRMSARELEHRSHSLAFAKALDLLHARDLSVEPSRGDVTHSFGVATKNHTNLGNEIVKTVDARLAPTYANQQPSPSATSQRSRGFVTNASQWATSTRREPTLAQAIAIQKADQQHLDESKAASARLRRVRANRGK
jgi:hypothetical protein